MQFEENQQPEEFILDGYEPGHIEINGEAHCQPVILQPGQIRFLEMVSPTELDAETLLQNDDAVPYPEVMLIGTGEKQIFLHPKIAAALAAKGIGLESMSTAAACRTYMVLQSEGRRVWAWLWP